MGLTFRNKKEVNTYLRQYAIRIERALIYSLEFFVAELQNHAKDSAGYQDRTGNLKASIGGVVLKNGKSIAYRGFTGSEEGTTTGKEFINSLISNVGSGYVVLVVAGMEYATYVEDIYSLNVLVKTELKMNRELPEVIERLKRRL